jgi:hypothetical protein
MLNHPVPEMSQKFHEKRAKKICCELLSWHRTDGRWAGMMVANT